MISENIFHAKKRWRERAMMLDTICQEIETAIASGLTINAAAKQVCGAYQGRIIEAGDDSRLIDISSINLLRHYYKWRAGGMTLDAFIPKYKVPVSKVPPELLTEIQRRCTMPGVVTSSVVLTGLKREWLDEKNIPGLGTWKEWWAANRPGWPVPDAAPDFPISDRTLYRYVPRGAARTWGNQGFAAARTELPWLTRDYSKLRAAELVVFDDVRLDLLALDDVTRRPTECNCYIAIEAGCRYVPAFVLRPANAMKKTDVDMLVCRALKILGIGKNYATHLYFERGMLTMSAAATEILTKASEGRIKVHFTSMNSARTHIGAHQDVPVGHWMGKAVIESFMRKLHLAMMQYPGQRGNKYENQPAALGWVGQGQTPAPGTLAREAAMLADIQLAVGRRLKLNFGILWVSEVNALIRQVIDAHNNDRNHNYQGFHTVTQKQVAPGIWKDVALCNSPA